MIAIGILVVMLVTNLIFVSYLIVKRWRRYRRARAERVFKGLRCQGIDVRAINKAGTLVKVAEPALGKESLQMWRTVRKLPDGRYELEPASYD